MRYFPIFLDLKDRPVVVVGGGEEALRKVRLLLKTEARIALVAPALHADLAAEPRVNWIARHYHAGLLDGATLVYAADRELAPRVADDAGALGIPVNAVDDPENSTFIVPSIVDRDPVVVAVGTEGKAPILGQGLRARIDALLPTSLGALAEAGAGLRQRAGAAIAEPTRRRAFWQRFFFGDVRDAFVAGESCNYLAGVDGLLRAEDRPAQGRVSFIAAPGSDSDLLTLRAQRKLIEADVIVHDRLIAPAILEVSRRDAVRIAVRGELYDGASDILIAEARAGRRVVRLSAGAPSLEETVSVAAEGIAFEAVPGVVVEESEVVESPATPASVRFEVQRAAS
jgi:uroporphyrin-III C-methyltransferase/precorrin-2 dehydrogenase/sirohydrochlorin ferrochelatase